MKEVKNKLMTKMTVSGYIFQTIVGIFLAIYCLSLVVPFFWALFTSFKSNSEYILSPFGLPEKISFENFKNIWGKLKVTVLTDRGTVRYGIGYMLFNTLFLAISISLLSVFFTTVMAYVLGRYKFIGSKFLTNLGIILMILPIIGTFPFQYSLFRRLGIYNNMFLYVLISPQGCFSGMNFLILRAAFKRIPWDYAEATFIDGGGHYSVFFRIMLPMILPTALVFFLLGFLGAWNDYGTSLIWLPSHPTLAYGMYIFQYEASKYGATIPEILSGFLIIMIPTAILYFSMQDLIISKVHMGGLKG